MTQNETDETKDKREVLQEKHRIMLSLMNRNIRFIHLPEALIYSSFGQETEMEVTDENAIVASIQEFRDALSTAYIAYGVDTDTVKIVGSESTLTEDAVTLIRLLLVPDETPYQEIVVLLENFKNKAQKAMSRIFEVEQNNVTELLSQRLASIKTGMEETKEAQVKSVVNMLRKVYSQTGGKQTPITDDVLRMLAMNGIDPEELRKQYITKEGGFDSLLSEDDGEEDEEENEEGYDEDEYGDEEDADEYEGDLGGAVRFTKKELIKELQEAGTEAEELSIGSKIAKNTKGKARG